jgi:muramoyltetrapeptide carboxypeptidase LdcA involved in peptidoglycan recycling
MKKGFDYSLEYFKKMLIENSEFELVSSQDWSDDLWFLDQENREFIPNEGMYCINEGSSEGLATGGNISTFNLLAGTNYFPDLTDRIILLEAHGEVKEPHFDRLLQQLIQQENFSKVKGLVIGKFQKDCQITQDRLITIIKNKKELGNIPVIANANFGHITPIGTVPLGGKLEIISSSTKCKIKIKV